MNRNLLFHEVDQLLGGEEMKVSKVRRIVGIGMLSSIAYLLMLLNFPLPWFPVFLKIDFSDIPALLAALIMGPIAGILVEFIKCILDYFFTGSDVGVPVGQLANFVAGVFLILPTYWIYQKMKTKKGLSIGLVSGTAVMALSMSVLNYYVFLPAYTLFLNSPAMSSEEMRSFITVSILPFNVLKGVFVTIVFMLIFTRLQDWIQNQRVRFSNT